MFDLSSPQPEYTINTTTVEVFVISDWKNQVLHFFTTNAKNGIFCHCSKCEMLVLQTHCVGNMIQFHLFYSNIIGVRGTVPLFQ